MEYAIVRLAERPELLEAAAEWFHNAWGISREAYRESMEASLTGGPVPQWYLAL